MRLPKIGEVQYASLNIECGNEDGGLYRSGICTLDDGGHALFYTREIGELTLAVLYLVPEEKIDQVRKSFGEDASHREGN